MGSSVSSGIQSSRAAAEAAEANRRFAEVLGQTQATNQEMLKQLQAMAKPAPPAKSGDWIPVRFKLTVEKPDGPPAVGYEVVLGRGYGGTKNNGAIHRRSDATGLADFGVVQPGDWEFSIQAGLRDTRGGLNAIPGTPVVKEIVCPKRPSGSGAGQGPRELAGAARRQGPRRRRPVHDGGTRPINLPSRGARIAASSSSGGRAAESPPWTRTWC